MKKYNSGFKNFAYLVYRWINPLFDPVRFYHGLKGYAWYFRDVIRYKRMGSDLPMRWLDSYPILTDKVEKAPFDSHYFYQNVWMFKRIIQSDAPEHVDVGSGLDFVSLLSTVKKVMFVDIRPIDVALENFQCVNGSILSLPYADRSVASLSCLHVAEHIGLGRYGDDVNPDGFRLALAELQRVLKPGGRLYFSTPVGKPAIYFNAHRVNNPVEIPTMADDLTLTDFAYINDSGELVEKAAPSDASGYGYACGMYIFTRPE